MILRMSDETMRCIKANGYECYHASGPCDENDPQRLQKATGLAIDPNEKLRLGDGTRLWRDTSGFVFSMPPPPLHILVLLKVLTVVRAVYTVVHTINQLRRRAREQQEFLDQINGLFAGESDGAKPKERAFTAIAALKQRAGALRARSKKN